MFMLRLTLGSLLLCLLAGGRTQAQPVYFITSSSVLSSNTLDSVATNGSGKSTLLTATGIDLNKITRCTAVAVDGLNNKLFFVDGVANSLWRVNLDGTGLFQVKSGLVNYPTDLALDGLNEKIYYTTSSTIQSNNTVQVMDYTGSNNATLFTALGGTGVCRCTALAVDIPHSKIFIADAGTNKIWSLSLTGTGLTALATTASNSFPTGVALDVTNQQVYFSVSSTVQNLNSIQRVNYNGSGLLTRYTASGSVQRCTALDLDVAHDLVYFSDAAANSLWRLVLNSDTPTALVSGLPATAKKVRWFSGLTTRPPPFLAGLQRSGTNIILNATNGFVGGSYYLLTSTNLAAPLSQWLPVSTNVLGASGNFTLTATNTFADKTPQRFYILRVQ